MFSWIYSHFKTFHCWFGIFFRWEELFQIIRNSSPSPIVSHILIRVITQFQMYVTIFSDIQCSRFWRFSRFYLILHKADTMFLRARQFLTENYIQKFSSQPHVTLINQDRIIAEFHRFFLCGHIFHFLCQQFLYTFHFHLNSFSSFHVIQRIEKGHYTFTVHRFKPRYGSSNRINQSPTITFQIITSSTGCPNGRPIPTEISDRITIIITWLQHWH